jgi:tetratricopeptide (TPR) repeat protein
MKLLWIAVVCFPLSLRADPRGEAQRLKGLAVAAKQRHDYPAALQFYRDALRTYESPNLHYNLALVLKELSQYAEAVDEFEKFLASPSGEHADPRARPRALAEIERLKRLIPPPPTPAPAPVVAPVVQIPTPVLEVKRELPPKRNYTLPTGFAIGAVSILAIGAGLYGSAVTDYNAFQDECKLRLCMPSDWRGSEAKQNAGIAFLAIGGAAVVVDVALWAWMLKHKGVQ